MIRAHFLLGYSQRLPFSRNMDIFLKSRRGCSLGIPAVYYSIARGIADSTTNTKTSHEMVKNGGVNYLFYENFRFACKKGDVGLVKTLIGKARLDQKDYCFRMACHYALLDIVKLLLQDPQVDPTTTGNCSVFRYHCKFGHLKVVELLLQDGRLDPSFKFNFALRYSCKLGRVDVVNLLLDDPRVDPTASEYSALRMACKEGHSEIVRRLLQDRRVDPSVQNNYAIRIASANGHADVVKLLLEDGRVDPSVRNGYPIRMASKNGHVSVVHHLTKNS